ncbi:MAG: hypothetical protein ACO3RB_04940 [Ilumatobacteraceae bacterium]
MRQVVRSLGMGAVLVVAAGCGDASVSLCDSAVSVAGYVAGFDQQLANFDSDQSAGLQPETYDVLGQVERISELDDVSPDVVKAVDTIDDALRRFADAMDDVLWDLPSALDDVETTRVVAEIGSTEMLAAANLIESELIDRCGLPPLIPIDTNVVPTLPMPAIPSPTATDPPVNTINEESEARALGTTVGELFSLVLSDADAICLGRALSGVYDATGDASTSAQYLRQFQSAFDRCNIDFTVPEG